jgi:DNA-binding transcriptional ArsR family regulator
MEPAVHIVRDLAHARLLADPLRLRLLHAFAGGPRTVKEVAADLGEAPTRLYRHVHALRDAKLLTVAGRRRVRGTVEHRYVAIAKRFEIDRALLGRAPGRRRPLPATLLDRAADELAAHGGLPRDAVVLRVDARPSPVALARLRKALIAWAESLDAADGDGPAWTATVALYPTSAD